MFGEVFFVFGCSSVFLAFTCIFLWFCYVFLSVFSGFFGFFICFPCYFFWIFLSFCYVFFSVCSIFFGFVVFSSQFAAHFAIFRVAASQISRFSSILRLQFWNLFLSLGFMLVSFRYISCRFYTDLMFSFDFTAFWFHLTNKRENLTHRFPHCIFCTIISAMVHHVYFIPRYVHFISQDWSAIISIAFVFTRQIWQQNHRPAITTTKINQTQL